jgi:flagellar hook-basal body complex protein FliE
MVDPISADSSLTIGPLRPATSRLGGRAAGEADFATQLRQQLEEVSRVQAEADEGIQNLLTGASDNITEVLTAARKAEVAFSLLMEIRNKLVDAYIELRQLRV